MNEQQKPETPNTPEKREPITTNLESKKTYDSINPAHYKTRSGTQPIDVIEAFESPSHISFALKHLLRLGKKPGEEEEQDCHKAIWYITRYITHVLFKPSPKINEETVILKGPKELIINFKEILRQYEVYEASKDNKFNIEYAIFVKLWPSAVTEIPDVNLAWNRGPVYSQPLKVEPNDTEGI